MRSGAEGEAITDLWGPVLTTPYRRAADLFGGGHVGVGRGSSDAPFETLHVSSDRPRPWSGNVSAILVISGNPTFESEGPRRDLLETLLAIWSRLRAQGRTGPG